MKYFINQISLDLTYESLASNKTMFMLGFVLTLIPYTILTVAVKYRVVVEAWQRKVEESPDVIQISCMSDVCVC